MDVGTINAKAIADHTKVYEKIFNKVNIKDGDSILLITWLHPTYHNKIKKSYPHSLILSIEDISVKFLWRNVLDGVVFLDLENKESLIKYTKENKMKFDHIIANPPYSLGNQITTTILNNVDFKEYVNLMPVSRYKGDKIYQHIIPNSLKKVEWTGDATTNPQVAILKKERDTTISEIDFNVWCCDPRFAKYYRKNMERKHYAIDKLVINSKLPDRVPTVKLDFYVSERAAVDGVHYTTSVAMDINWNIHKNIDLSGIKFHKVNHTPAGGWIPFNTEEENKNFTKWWYSEPKVGLMSKLLTGGPTGAVKERIPKVDWTHEWTDEKILKDYGYTDEEIKELLK